ncbi:MAG: hypothetical protein K0B08_11375 [Bacteroidales bacterium]|nr:hypothetical protein [Bacteroidales bacterium]
MNKNKPNELHLYRQLSWDYMIPAEDIALLVSGQIDHVGHYTIKDIFKKALESYSWFTVLRLFSPEQVMELLTDDLIQSLRMPSMRKHYAFIKKRLQENLSSAG